MKRIFLLLILTLILTGCKSAAFAADRLPWVSNDVVLFKDNFSDQSGGWATHQDAVSFSGYDSGGFRLSSQVPNYQFWSVPGLNFKDSYVFTRIVKLGGPDDNLMGVICRYQNEENYYALVFGTDGYYGIYKTIDGEQTLIDQDHMDFSEVIQRGNQENRIHAVCKENRLVLIVNDVELLSVEDDSLTHGDVGLIIGNFSQPGVDVLFDDFIVLKP